MRAQQQQIIIPIPFTVFRRCVRGALIRCGSIHFLLQGVAHTPTHTVGWEIGKPELDFFANQRKRMCAVCVFSTPPGGGGAPHSDCVHAYISILVILFTYWWICIIPNAPRNRKKEVIKKGFRGSLRSRHFFLPFILLALLLIDWVGVCSIRVRRISGL